LIKKGFVYAFCVLLLLIFCKNGLEEMLIEDWLFLKNGFSFASLGPLT